MNDAGEGVSEPGLGVDVVELGRLDQGVGDGGGTSAGLRPDEEALMM